MTATPRFPRRPFRPGSAIHFGADHNPDQWPEETSAEDVALMKEAGVTVVTLPVFSWAHIQPREDVWDLDWLDRVMDLMSDAGIDVDMATSTASPPAWLTTKHPEILPVTRTGETLWPGGRQHWRPTSPVFRHYALELTRALAERYRDHPALVAWHVSNELGCHNAYDYSDDAARAFRVWLQERYANLDALNDAWGTMFWSQRYDEWDEILPPRLAASEPNPTQLLDFRRFSSDALRDYLRAESAVLREITPGVPITTNFMVMGGTRAMDYPSWTGDVDFVSNDHYLDPAPGGVDELAFSASFTSAMAQGKPWWLMEHSTSAVNWRPVNPPKAPGELMRDALTHLGHGADAICYFQWRASRAGAEKYHAAMLPHAGADSRVFRDVVALGRALEAAGEMAGSEALPARVAVLLDYESWWSLDEDFLPSTGLDYRGRALAWYRALVSRGVRVDVVSTRNDLSRYDLLVAPLLHVVPTALAERLERAVRGGTHLVTTYFSGTVDENDHVVLGGYPGALCDLLGVHVEEMAPLLAGVENALQPSGTGRTWSEEIVVDADEVDVLRRWVGTRTIPDGAAAVTRRRLGEGSATYVATALDGGDLEALASELLELADVASELPAELAGQVIAAVRRGPEADYWTLTNRGAAPCGTMAQVASCLGGTPLAGPDELGASDAVVVRVPRA